VQINSEILQEIINIEVGLFAPLDGFMDSKDYRNVVDECRLSSGEVFTLPITLDSDEAVFEDEIYLECNGKKVAKIEVEDVFKIKEDDIKKIFKTDDINHPGVSKELKRGKYRIGGKVKLLDKTFLNNTLNPTKTKELFKTHKTIAGFQTRNIPHRAHEHLHRLALEFCDALFINPLVGWKKKGDFSEKAVEAGYKALINNYYTNLNVYFDTLKTPMRYAGPREAVFHAIIRYNLGCTHFIIGRDHAGVGNYYGKYEAQEFAFKLQKDLKIKILPFKEPSFCPKCEMIVSERSCGHSEKEPISGTMIRKMLSSGEVPPSKYIRKEVAKAVIALGEDMFIR
jgi:sulfate adenylyltransferase